MKNSIKIEYERYQVLLEIIGALLLFGMFIYLFVNWSEIPQAIPGHYNALGEVDRWGGKSEVFILPAIGAVIYLLVTVVSLFPKAWNIPARVTDENREAVYRATRDLIIFEKIEILGIFFFITVYISKAEPLPGAFLPVSLLIIFGTIAFFIVRIIHKAKNPRDVL